MDLHHLPPDHDDLGERPSWPPDSQVAREHPQARHIWSRLMRAHERRGLAFDAEELAAVALTVAEAMPDPLGPWARLCIHHRNGRECPVWFNGRPMVQKLCEPPF